jgi:hypothetical protein
MLRLMCLDVTSQPILEDEFGTAIWKRTRELPLLVVNALDVFVQIASLAKLHVAFRADMVLLLQMYQLHML